MNEEIFSSRNIRILFFAFVNEILPLIKTASFVYLRACFKEMSFFSQTVLLCIPSCHDM